MFDALISLLIYTARSLAHWSPWSSMMVSVLWNPVAFPASNRPAMRNYNLDTSSRNVTLS